VRRFGIAIVVAAALVVAALPAHAGAGSPAKPQVCGTPPGDGAYSYVKAWNIGCARARRVAENALERFCDRDAGCSTPIGSGYLRGTERFNGWDCGLKLGYEFLRVRCEKPHKRLVWETAA